VIDKKITLALVWDRLGIGVSAICAVHCLSIPVLVSLLPLWPVHTGLQGWVHPVTLLLLLPITYFAARRSHWDQRITTLLGGGILLVLSGWLIGHYWLGLVSEILLTLTGSILLILGHWRNYRHHQRCTNRRHQHHPIAETISELAERLPETQEEQTT